MTKTKWNSIQENHSDRPALLSFFDSSNYLKRNLLNRIFNKDELSDLINRKYIKENINRILSCEDNDIWKIDSREWNRK